MKKRPGLAHLKILLKEKITKSIVSHYSLIFYFNVSTSLLPTLKRTTSFKKT